MGKLIFEKPIDAPEGSKPTHAYGNSVRDHHGIDYPAPKGTDIIASERGIVVKAGQNDTDIKLKFGNVIVIDHTPKAADNEPHLYTVYGHLRNKDIEEGPFADNIKAGVEVEKGQLIGYSGNTGLTSGPHLHFGVAHIKMQLTVRSGDGATGISASDYSPPTNISGTPIN